MKPPVRLNLGAGSNPIEGYTNLDITEGWRFEDGFPAIPDKSVDVITISHALMYVAERDYPYVFGEFARVMKDSGLIRITEDNTIDPKSDRFGGYEDAVTLTHMGLMEKHLRQNGFLTIPVSARKTNYFDSSILQAHHGTEPKVFFIEGIKLNHMGKFQESALAHKYLDGLDGIEIGGGAHNAFGLKTKNVDYSGDMDTLFKRAEEEACGERMPVDIVAEGDDLPLEDESVDFVVSSHVIEHFFDPIKALNEWKRVVRPGGYIFIIAPHANRVPDEHRSAHPLSEFIARHDGTMKPEEVNFDGAHGGKSDRGHWSVWTTETFIEMCRHFGFNVIDYLNIDDKVGNGFAIVIQK